MGTVFEDLHPAVRNLLEERGFDSPTPIQEEAIPVIAEGENVLVIAPTGIGKTEAAFLPLFSQLVQRKEEGGEEEEAPGITVLYITPLKALNRDLLDRMEWWAEELGLTLQVRHGDTTQYQRSKQAKNPPQILISTPETVQNIIPAKKMGEHLKNVEYVVVDEIHELVESKRGTQLGIGLERLAERGGGSQRIGLSATVGSPEETAKFLAGTYREARIVDTSHQRGYQLTVEHPLPIKEDKELLSEMSVPAPVIARLRRLHELIDQHQSVLCFVNTRSMAELLSSRMSAWDSKHGIKVHHSSLSKDVRVVAEKEFKDGSVKGLLSTSSLELGIDIGRIDLVAQYMSPRQVCRVVQRVGRSGHSIEKKPKGIILCSNPEDVLEAGVITWKARKGELEQVRVHENALDVLAHQLVGLSMDQGRIRHKKAFEIVRRAYLYRDLEYDEFKEVLEQLAAERYIWLDSDTYRKRRGAFKYYFTSVSMIPDEQRFFVKNTATGKNVGMLDEAFVAENLQSGVIFITKGSPWRVLDVREREVLVEPAFDITAAIPDWAGEQIPVPFQVAQEVGKVRRKKKLLENLPLDSEARKVAVDSIKKQEESGFMPDDRTIVLETRGSVVFMHAHFGSLVNETLGKVLCSLLTSFTGRTVRMKSDPYRITFEFPSAARPELMKQFLEELEEGAVEELLSRNLSRSSLFKYEFIHVARRFGFLEKGAKYKRVGIRKIISAVMDSPIAREVLNSLKVEKLDIPGTKKVISRIKKGGISIEIVKTKKPSEFASFSRATSDLMLPERAEADILELVKERVLSKNAHLACTYCHHSWYEEIKDLPSRLECPECGSTMITYVQKRGAKKVLGKEGKLSEEEKQEKEKLMRIAKLVNAHGRKAVIALTARGVGPETASRILRREHKNQDALFKDLMEAERTFTRTHKYWS